jgi:Zn-dependent protease
MGGDGTPLLWLIVLFAPLLSVKRWLSRHLQGVGLLLFGNLEGATALHYIVLLPGVVLHEFSHWLAAKLVGVRTAGMSLVPRVQRGGTVRLGAVKVGSYHLHLWRQREDTGPGKGMGTDRRHIPRLRVWFGAGGGHSRRFSAPGH